MITYLVYFNANNFSTFDKKDTSKIPWLNSTKKNTNTNEDQSQDSNDDELPDFITDQCKKTLDPEVQNVNNNEIIEIGTDLSLEKILNMTHIIGFRETAEQINVQICNTLPIENEKYLISYSKDIINGEEQECESADYLMKNKTNLPSVLRLQIGCRVMFLNNKHIKKQIANGTIGVVVDVDKIKEIVRVAFCVNGGMVDIEVGPEPMHFFINGIPACRVQYPLQNAFALTSHKAQSITLPQASLYLDNQMFAPGQAYVAISRCQSWDDIQILSLSPDAFLVDQRVKEEYKRLEQISSQNLPI